MKFDPVLHDRIIIMQEMGRRRVGMYEFIDRESGRYIGADVVRLDDRGGWDLKSFDVTQKKEALKLLQSYLSEDMRLDPAGIVYMVFAWLTQQMVPLTFSANHDAVTAANMAQTFCKENGLWDPKEGFQEPFVPMGTTPLGPIAEPDT